MYRFKQSEEVRRVMQERRGPDDRYVKGWGHHKTASVICGLIVKYKLKSFIEVGACGCQLSEIVLIEFPDVQVWSIDRHFKDITNNQGKLTSAPIERMKEQFGARYNAIKEHSPGTAAHFSDGTIDIVYIDALHKYHAVRADIFAWWPKVSAHGILSGHDYKHSANPGVSKAVDEIFSYVNVADYHNWWVLKEGAKTKVALP